MLLNGGYRWFRTHWRCHSSDSANCKLFGQDVRLGLILSFKWITMFNIEMLQLSVGRGKPYATIIGRCWNIGLEKSIGCWSSSNWICSRAIAELNNDIYPDFKQIFKKFIQGRAWYWGGKKKWCIHHTQQDSNSEEDRWSTKTRIVFQTRRNSEWRWALRHWNMCARPDVEVWDTTADDPKLLVFLKAYWNTVPVPR